MNLCCQVVFEWIFFLLQRKKFFQDDEVKKKIMIIYFSFTVWKVKILSEKYGFGIGCKLQLTNVCQKSIRQNMFDWDRKTKCHILAPIGTLYEEQQRFMIVPTQMQRICKKFEVKMTSAYLKKMSLTSYRQNVTMKKNGEKKRWGKN